MSKKKLKLKTSPLLFPTTKYTVECSVALVNNREEQGAFKSVAKKVDGATWAFSMRSRIP